MALIAHLITDLRTGGAERMLVKLLAGMGSECFEAYVICVGRGGTQRTAIEDLGVPVSTLDIHPRKPSPGDFWRLTRVTRALAPDIVQGWMYHGNLAATWVRLSRACSAPVVWNVRQSLNHLEGEKRTTRYAIRVSSALSSRAQAIIYNSRRAREQHEALGFEPSKALVIPNGFDTEIFRPDHGRRFALRRRLGLPEGAFLVGHVARAHPMKDHATFLAAVERVMDRHGDFYAILIGPSVDSRNSKITALIPLIFKERIQLLGERADVSELMPAMDVLCLSSAWGEAFPNVVGEAMACGVPCIVTDVGDAALVVGDTGRVVSPQDPEALARAILGMKELTDSERQTIGRAARRRVKARYSLQAVVREYEVLYGRVMEEAG